MRKWTATILVAFMVLGSHERCPVRSTAPLEQVPPDRPS